MLDRDSLEWKIFKEEIPFFPTPPPPSLPPGPTTRDNDFMQEIEGPFAVHSPLGLIWTKAALEGERG